MYSIKANRALGIIHQFLIKKPEINTWFLPSTICFSVPMLFKNLNKKIVFYDFSFSLLNQLQNITYKSGILVADYFGKPFEINEINELKNFYETVIYDRCLTFPELIENKNVNLLLYSFGFEKPVDIGGGAFAYSDIELEFNFQTNFDTISGYNHLELNWKKAIKNKEKYNVDILPVNMWIDTQNSFHYKITDIELKSNEVSKEKALKNEIYSNYIPFEFLLHEEANNWRYNILVDDNKRVCNAIFDIGLFCSSHFASAAFYLYAEKHNNSDMLECQIVNLFNNNKYTIQQVEKTAILIRKLIDKKAIKAIN